LLQILLSQLSMVPTLRAELIRDRFQNIHLFVFNHVARAARVMRVTQLYFVHPLAGVLESAVGGCG
jgi:hypothetical protein